MSKLARFLKDKKQALVARREKLAQTEAVEPLTLKANVRVAGRSGVREIRIRDFQIISDSPEDFAGHSLGPGSPELQLGVLGSCISHVTLIQAADLGVALDALEVEVTGHMHPLAGRPGYENIPVYPHGISYTLHLTTTESEDTIAALHQAVEQACPILNLLANPQRIDGNIVIHPSSSAGQPA